MKRTLEKIAVLSLSFMLVSTYSVSAALPSMIPAFGGRSRTEVEQLISITSFAITAMIILSTWLSHFLSQKVSIILGMLLTGAAGSVPMFIQKYEVIFAARILLGIGLGLLCTHAFNTINERYEGDERANMLGLRGSVEVLGNAVLTLIAGQLLRFGWTKAFAVYLAAFPILALYLLCVPASGNQKADSDVESKKMKQNLRPYLPAFLSNIGMGIFLICINSCNTMRIPALIEERGLGTGSASGLVLSLMLLTGILSGLWFGRLVKLFSGRLMAVGMLLFGCGMAVIVLSDHIAVLAAGAMIAGFSNNILVTALFHQVSVTMPQDIMPLGTTSALIGCNMGSFFSSYVLRVIGIFGSEMSLSFTVCTVVTFAVAVFLFWKKSSPSRS